MCKSVCIYVFMYECDRERIKYFVFTLDLFYKLESEICVAQSAFLKKIIYFWLRWVFVAARGLSLVVASRGYSSLWCAGFSLLWFLLLPSTGSRHTGFSSCGSRALERRLGSCGTRAKLLCGMWDLPRPGLEPVSPALAGEFLTAEPPGKPQSAFSLILLY